MKLKRNIRAADASAAADALGQRYVDLRESLKARNSERGLVVSKIKALALEVGVAEGAQTTVSGDRFKVGFVTSAPRRDVDWAAFKKQRPKLYARLCSMQIDSQKVEDALADGSLPRELLEKFVVPAGEPVDRVVCEEIGKTTNENLDEMD